MPFRSSPLWLLAVAGAVGVSFATPRADGQQDGAFELVLPAEGDDFAPAPTPAATELLSNGGFEASRPLANWALNGAAFGPDEPLSIIDSPTFDGRRALRLSGTAGRQLRRFGVQQTVAIEGGDWLAVRANLRVPRDGMLAATRSTVRLQVQFSGDEAWDAEAPGRLGARTEQVVSARTPPERWVVGEFVLRAPDAARRARLAIVFLQSALEGGVVLVDGVSLRSIPQPPEHPLPGDYNRDGRVDAADSTVWSAARTQEGPERLRADGNGDGFVDDADREVWRANYGRRLSAPAMD